MIPRLVSLIAYHVYDRQELNAQNHSVSVLDYRGTCERTCVRAMRATAQLPDVCKWCAHVPPGFYSLYEAALGIQSQSNTAKAKGKSFFFFLLFCIQDRVCNQFTASLPYYDFLKLLLWLQ